MVKYKLLFAILSLCVTVSCLAKDRACNATNVSNSLECIMQENEKLIFSLQMKVNNDQTKIKEIKMNVKNNCSKVDYSLGSGSKIIKESCLNTYYKNLLSSDNLKSNTSNLKLKNVDGYLLSDFPYNSEKHVRCLKNYSKDCNGYNFINANDLRKEYNFINKNSNKYVVFENKENNLNIFVTTYFVKNQCNFVVTALNKFGVVSNFSTVCSKNITLDQKYKIKFYDVET